MMGSISISCPVTSRDQRSRPAQTLMCCGHHPLPAFTQKAKVNEKVTNHAQDVVHPAECTCLVLLFAIVIKSTCPS